MYWKILSGHCPYYNGTRLATCLLVYTVIYIFYTSLSCLEVVEKFLEEFPFKSANAIAFSTYTENLAARKNTDQSSTYSNQLASGTSAKAVDGNPDTKFKNGHCSHTKKDNPSWWRVDLGSDNVPVYEVHIVNRFSQLPDVRQRNRNYIITLGKYSILLLRQTLDSSKRYQLVSYVKRSRSKLLTKECFFFDRKEDHHHVCLNTVSHSLKYDLSLSREK